MYERVSAASLRALVARVTRLFRLIPACMKVHEQRSNALTERKHRVYAATRVGSPVERVLAILQRLKRAELDSPADRSDLNFIMEMIVSDELYSCNVNTDALSIEQQKFICQESMRSIQNVSNEAERRPKGQLFMANLAIHRSYCLVHLHSTKRC